MIRKHVDDLETGIQADEDLFHESGSCLLKKGRIIDATLLSALEKAGITDVFMPEPHENINDLKKFLKTKSVPVNQLSIGERSDKPLYGEDGTLLLEEGVNISEGLAERLRKRGVNEVYMQRTPAERNVRQYSDFCDILESMSGVAKADDVELDPSGLVSGAEISEDLLEIELLTPDSLRVRKGGTPVEREMKERDPLAPRKEAEKEEYTLLHKDIMDISRKVFNIFSMEKAVEGKMISDLTKKIISAMIQDCDLLMNIINMKSRYGFLIEHTVGVTILTLNLGASRGLSKQQLLELGFGAFLHNIGMLKVPPEIIMKKGKLTPEEYMEVKRHSISGLDMLENVDSLPKSAPFIAYQVHERLDGSGYPKGRKGVFIHDFSKMIAVCDMLLAMASERPYRPAMTPYKAMETTIHLASRKLINPNDVRALLKYTSLFPIGSWVELSDGSQGKVVCSGGEEFTKPVVSVVTEGNLTLSQPRRVDLKKEKDLRIVKALDIQDDSVMNGF